MPAMERQDPLTLITHRGPSLGRKPLGMDCIDRQVNDMSAPRTPPPKEDLVFPNLKGLPLQGGWALPLT